MFAFENHSLRGLGRRVKTINFVPKRDTVLDQTYPVPSGAGLVGCGDAIIALAAAQTAHHPRVSGLARGFGERNLSTGLCKFLYINVLTAENMLNKMLSAL